MISVLLRYFTHFEMKKNKDNERLVSFILGRIPQNIKKTSFLTSLLNLSNESAYRRLRGEIPFSVEELVKLSQKLNFSIDEAIMQSSVSEQQAVFNMRAANTLSGASEIFVCVLKDYCNDVIKEKDAKSRSALMSLNHLILPFTFNSENLFKFNYYKWMHQTGNVPLNFSFSEVIIPYEIDSLRRKAADLSDSVDNSTFILDQDMYLHTIKDIQYYYRRSLITREELQLIQKELGMIIDASENIALTGVNRLGKSRYYYLSPLNIKSNIILVEYDNNIVSHLWYHSITPISTTNVKLCMAHKQWLNSLKKYSSLITQSNDILSAEFFNKQRKYISEMDIVL